MKRLLANMALMRDVLVLASRRKLLGIYLVIGTAVVCVSVFGAEVVPVTAEEPTWALEFFGISLWKPSTAPLDVATPALVLNHYWVMLIAVATMSLFGLGMGVLATLTSVSSAFEPGQAELILPRPVSRAEVALSRFAGAILFGLLQASWVSLLLFILTGFKFHFWWPELLLVGPALMLKYAVVVSICTAALVVTRSRALAIMVGGMTWVVSYSINLLQLTVTNSGPRNALRELAPQIKWVQRIFPQIPHQDFLASGLFGQEPEFSAAQVLLQGVVWVVLPLLVTTVVVSRRDY